MKNKKVRYIFLNSIRLFFLATTLWIAILIWFFNKKSFMKTIVEHFKFEIRFP